MKAYLAVTGVVFLLLSVAHVVRVVGERHLARDPWFVLVTVLSLGFAVWAVQLYRKAARS